MLNVATVFKRYYQLSKPGIVYANVITAIAGYFLASTIHINWVVFGGLIAGIALVIAGSCAYNNVLDRKIDKAMARTRKRSLVTGDLSARAALIYATLTSALGFALLLATQNGLTVIIVLIGMIDYVILYGYAKRKTVHGTIIGSISGSVALVAGYTAFTGRFDAGAALLLSLMTAWQMAHFYGIALYRQKDYAAAKIPVYPVVFGADATRQQIIAYIILFVVASVSLAVAGFVNIVTAFVLVALGLVWLQKSLVGYSKLSSDAWGKRVFLFSLTVMLGMSLSLALGSPTLF